MKRLTALAAIIALAGCAAEAPSPEYVAAAPAPVYKCRPLERPSAALPDLAGFAFKPRPVWWRVMTRDNYMDVWESLAAEGIGAVAWMTPAETQSAFIGFQRLNTIIHQHRSRGEAIMELLEGADSEAIDASDPPKGVEVIPRGDARPVIRIDCGIRPLPALDLPDPWEFEARPWSFRIMERDEAESEWERIETDAIVYVLPSHARNMLLDMRDLLVILHVSRLGNEALADIAEEMR